MPTLAELVSESSVEEFQKYALDVAVEMENRDQKEGSLGRYSMYKVFSDSPELGVGLVRAVYNEMWKHAKPMRESRNGYTHRVEWEHTVTPVIKRMFGEIGILEGATTKANTRANYNADAIRRVLFKNRIASSAGRGMKPMFLRWWPEGEQIDLDSLQNVQREDYRDAQRRETEEKKAEKTVVVKHKLDLIEPPEPTPEGMVRWAKQMIEAYKGLTAKYDDLTARHQALLEKNEQVEAELEKYANKAQYGEAADEIRKLLNGGGN